MKRPTSRAGLPERNDNHRNRELATELSQSEVTARFAGIRYLCYGKHKSNPYLYGVEPYRGTDTDRVLCDTHANFHKSDFSRIPALFARARAAGLVGNLMWTVDDTGWIYELQNSNSVLNEWHGYPLLPSDTFAPKIWNRYREWAHQFGSRDDRTAVERCALLYGCKP